MPNRSKLIRPDHKTVAIPYNGSPNPTLGVEMELQLLDPESWNLVSKSVEILDIVGYDTPIKQELTQSTVEIVTDVCKNVQEVRADLTKTFETLYEVGEKINCTYAGAGTHPFAQWREQKIFPNDRYQDLVNRIQWPARRLMIYGLHVHVGVKSGEKAISILNALTTFLPHFLALSSSSPFLDFEDTGLASARAKIFEGMPTAGLPFRLGNYGEFQSFMNSLVNSGAISTIREIWWDIRPHPGYGTLEVRVCDIPSTLSEVCSLTALIQCIVVTLDRCYDEGSMPELLHPWIVRENKWRASRYGLDAQVIVNNQGNQEPLLESISDLVDELIPLAKELGCENELKGINTTLKLGSSSSRQREIYYKDKDFKTVIKHLADSLKQDIFETPFC